MSGPGAECMSTQPSQAVKYEPGNTMVEKMFVGITHFEDQYQFIKHTDSYLLP